MASTTNVLSKIDYSGQRYSFENNNITDKIMFVEQKPLERYKKIIKLPELEYNPQYNQITSTIADANLALQIKENFENINYVPITSTGYRGFSALNSRKNGVKTGFNDNLLKQMTSYKYSITEPKVKSEFNTVDYPSLPSSSSSVSSKAYKRVVIPEVLTRLSLPADFNPKDLPTSSDGSTKSDIGNEIYNAIIKARPSPIKDYGEEIFEAHKKASSSKIFESSSKYTPPQARGKVFKEIEKNTIKAKKEQSKESLPGSGNVSTGPRRKGTGKLTDGKGKGKKEDSDGDISMGS